MAAVAALTIGVAPHVPGAVSAIAGRLGGTADRPVAGRELALAAAALRGEAAAPTVEDAAVLLGDLLGPAAAGRALDELAATTLGPAQVGSDPLSRERPRAGRISGHVVTAAEEAFYRPVLVLRRRNASEQRAAMTLLTTAVAAVLPELAPLGFAVALTGGDDDGALPPATRTGDAVLCVPVDTAAGAALVLAVVRDGRLLQRKVVRRARCPA
ncbi:MAG: hypothetical protein QOE98_2596 [Gaiellaceae bacterium]|nr:hypothetical protein [Gaiellaceae bacterium]